jgi:hypothetical protein
MSPINISIRWLWSQAIDEVPGLVRRFTLSCQVMTMRHAFARSPILRLPSFNGKASIPFFSLLPGERSIAWIR